MDSFIPCQLESFLRVVINDCLLLQSFIAFDFLSMAPLFYPDT